MASFELRTTESVIEPEMLLDEEFDADLPPEDIISVSFGLFYNHLPTHF